MASSKQNDAAAQYHYTVTFSAEENQYCSRVAEFPAVVSLHDTATGALSEAQSLVAELVQQRIERNLPIPESENPETEFSGRLNLRVPVALHRTLSRQAELNRQSLNQWCSYLLAVNATTESVQTAISAALDPDSNSGSERNLRPIRKSGQGQKTETR